MRQAEAPAGDARPADHPTTAAAPAALVTILARIGEDYPFETALDDAAQSGFEFRFTWSDPTTAYEEVWEHPAATEHNATLDRRTAAILETFLFKLYALRDGHAWDGAAPYLLTVGRIGNTSTYEILTSGPTGDQPHKAMP